MEGGGLSPNWPLQWRSRCVSFFAHGWQPPTMDPSPKPARIPS